MPFNDPLNVHNPTALTPVSSAWGDQVRDDVVWLAGDGASANPKPMCRALNAPGQSIAHNTWSALFAVGEDFDTAGMHVTSGGSVTARITIPAGGTGVYRLIAAIGWNVAAGGTSRLLRLRKNGASNVTPEVFAPPSASQAVGQCITALVKLTAGDYVEAHGYQDSGANLNVTLVEFSAEWVGVG